MAEKRMDHAVVNEKGLWKWDYEMLATPWQDALKSWFDFNKVAAVEGHTVEEILGRVE